MKLTNGHIDENLSNSHRCRIEWHNTNTSVEKMTL